MKKLLLSIAFLAAGFVAFGQTTTLTQNWALKVGVSSLISTGSGSTGNPSVAYNKVTDKLYLADWNSKISIIDPITGASLGTLATDALWTDGDRYMKVRVTDDGVIYAVSRRLSAGNLAVYRWASETDNAPTRHEIAVPNRSGDSFAVFGTGNNTRIFISGGTATPAITVAGVTDGVVAKLYDIPVTAHQSRTSISAQSESSVWINTAQSGTGWETRRVNFNPSTGAITSTDVVPAAKIITNWANTEYFEVGNKKFLAVSGAIIGGTPAATNEGLKMRIYDITTDFANPVYVAEGEMFPYVASTFPTASSNTNAYGDVAVKVNPDGTCNFFHVVFGSGLAKYTTDTPLPVSLTSFSAALVKGESTLTWETASEVNNQGFEVLRSTNGQTFSKIDFVSSKAKNGNSSNSLSYSYIDATANAGINYYKLQQVDLDGKTELFDKIVSVEVSLNANSIIPYPNPATTFVRVNTGTADYKGFKYELFDMNGKKVLSEKAKALQQEISLADLPSAVYYLKISKDNKVQTTAKLIKQ